MSKELTTKEELNMEANERFEQLKATIFLHAQFGWHDQGHMSRLDCMRCEHACAEAVEEIVELIEQNPDFDPNLDEIIQALYEGDKDDLAEYLESCQE